MWTRRLALGCLGLVALWLGLSPWLRGREERPAAEGSARLAAGPEGRAEDEPLVDAPPSRSDERLEVAPARVARSVDEASSDERATASEVLFVVRDALSGAPIAGASLRAGDAPPRTTDDEGSCRVPLPATLDTYPLQVEAAGYLHLVGTGRHRERFAIELRPLFAVEVTVVDLESGRPLPGAELSLLHPQCVERELAPLGACDGEGRLVVQAPVRDAGLHLFGSAPGHPQQWAILPVQQPDEPGGVRRATMALREGVRLRLQVHDLESGAPLAGVRPGAGERDVQSDDAGRLELHALTNLEDGRVYLSLEKEGYCPLSIGLPEERVRAAIVRAPMVRAVGVRGVVRDEAGAIVPGAQVCVQPDFTAMATEREPASPLDELEEGLSPQHPTFFSSRQPCGTSAEDGSFAIEPCVVPWHRSYAVSASREGFETTVQPLSRAGLPGEVLEQDLVLTRLAPKSSVEGSVSWNGERWAHGSVRWSSGPDGGRVGIDFLGRYRIEDAPAGAIALVVEPFVEAPGSLGSLAQLGDASAREVTPASFAPVSGQQASLDLAPGEARRFDFDLRSPTGTIAGMVLGAEREPLAGVTVHAVAGVGLGGTSTETDAEGAFRLTLTDHGLPYTVSVPHTVLPARAEGVPLGTEDLVLGVATRTRLFLRVRDAETNRTLVGLDARWRALGSDTWQRPPAFVHGADGTYWLDVAAGRPIEVAVAPEDEDDDHAIARLELELEPDRVHEREVTLVTLPPLLLETRPPIPPARFRLEPLDTSLPPFRGRQHDFVFAGGSAVVHGLAPGRYRLVPLLEGLALEPEQLTIGLERSQPIVLGWSRTGG